MRIPFKIESDQKKKVTKILISPSIFEGKSLWKFFLHFFQKEIPSKLLSLDSFLKKSSKHCDFENCRKFFQLHEKIKPTRNLLCTNIYMYIYTLVSHVYTILFWKDLKKKKVRHQHRQNKTKIFGVKSEILINDKRIKWTLSRKASHLLSGG